MNEFWKAIVDVLKPASVAAVFFAVVGFVARGMFTQWLKQDLEGYKADLKRAAADHEAELDRMAFEHETRYARLHEERAEVIAEIYKHLCNIESEFGLLKVTGESEKWVEKVKPLTEHVTLLLPCFREKRIYLDEPLCSRIDGFIALMRQGAVAPLLGEKTGDVERYQQDLEAAQAKLPMIRKEIEAQFRGILGVSNEAE